MSPSRWPSVVAEHDGAELTAGELDRRADAVAHWLGDHGITTGARVGIRLPWGFDVLVAVHGVMRSGAAFVMLDPDDPAARHDVIAADADLAVTIDDIDDVAGGGDALPDAGSDPNTDSGVDVDLDDIAYVLYTSGLDRPAEGCADPAPRARRLSRLRLRPPTPPVLQTFVMPLYSSLGFDLSITSLFLPQLVGGRTVVFSDDAVTAVGSHRCRPQPDGAEGHTEPTRDPQPARHRTAAARGRDRGR